MIIIWPFRNYLHTWKEKLSFRTCEVIHHSIHKSDSKCTYCNRDTSNLSIARNDKMPCAKPCSTHKNSLICRTTCACRRARRRFGRGCRGRGSSACLFAWGDASWDDCRWCWCETSKHPMGSATADCLLWGCWRSRDLSAVALNCWAQHWWALLAFSSICSWQWAKWLPPKWMQAPWSGSTPISRREAFQWAAGIARAVWKGRSLCSKNGTTQWLK